VNELERVASLVAQRNEIDLEIAAITRRPVVAGHLGEWIASRIFDIELEQSATARAIDGRFRSGPLAGETVNVKWYGRLEGLLDMTTDESLDHYLVLAGPRGAAITSYGSTRPLVIKSVFVIESRPLLEDLAARGRKVGTAASVRREWWDRSQIYPEARHPKLTIDARQRAMLALFGLPR
jgi:hypothetical protein